MSDFINMRLNRYEIRERIGAGGMARVFKAWDTMLERPVALKILHDHLADDPTFKERFVREARFVANLSHPNIVQVYDFGTVERDGFPLYYMVMSYVPGKTLRDLIESTNAQGQRLPQAQVLRIIINLADALGYAHAQGTVHRDVKPGNVLINNQGDAVLTDFGIARMVESSRLTQDGISTGTPLYMSPEQASGQSGDSRSDLYSLGIILYELLTGKPPYEDNGAVSVMMRHISAPIPQISKVLGVENPALDLFMNKALAKSPSERFQSAGEFSAEASAVLRATWDRNTPTPTLNPHLPSATDLSQPITPGSNFITPAQSPSVTQTLQRTATTSFAFLFGVLIAAIVIIAAAVVVVRDQITRATGTPPESSLTSSIASMTEASNSGTLPLIQASEAYFSTDFDTDEPTNQYWMQDEVGGFIKEITQDGFYRLTLNRPDTAETSMIYAERAYSSVGVEILATLDPSSAPASAYGVVFRYQDPDNFNVFAVDGLGRFSIWKREDAVWTELRAQIDNWTSNEQIRLIGERNRVAIEVAGNTLTGYVNNRRIVRLTDSTFSSGQVGIYFATDDGEAVLNVDSFKVYPSVPSMTGQ